MGSSPEKGLGPEGGSPKMENKAKHLKKKTCARVLLTRTSLGTKEKKKDQEKMDDNNRT